MSKAKQLWERNTFMRRSNKLGLAVTAVLGLSAAATAGVPVSSYSLTTLATFNGTNGGAPGGGELLLSGSTLYGTTCGGANGDGNVFSLPVTGGTPTTLATFNGTNGCAPDATLALSGTTLYGTTQGDYSASAFGTVYSVSTTGSNFTNLATISVGELNYGPQGGVIVSGSTLYGTSNGAGANADGMVFSVPASGGSVTALHSYDINGSGPLGSIVLSGSTLYGVTMGGGDNATGTVYSVSTNGGNYTILASFSSDSGGAAGGLIISGNTIYGMTSGDGSTSFGSVYSVSTSGGNITTMATFNGTNGNEPMCELTLSGSTLYGTTYKGGAYNDGTVFSVPTDGGGTAADVTTLYSFSGTTDGAYPVGGVVISGGDIYGTTTSGGAGGEGTVFELTPTAVPEPASLGLLVAGGVGVLARRRRRRV